MSTFLTKSKRWVLVLSAVVLVCPLLYILFKPVHSTMDYSFTGNIEYMKNNSMQMMEIPILEYHCVDNKIFGRKDLFVSPKRFYAQIKYLHDNGYTPVTFDELDRVSNIRKPVMITFDDGYEDNYLEAYPVLEKYKFRATIFLITNSIGHKNFLNRNELYKMQDIIDFESHTVHHKHLAALPRAQVEYELRSSQIALENLLHKKIVALAYPFGNYNSDVVSVAEKYYKYGIATATKKTYTHDSNYEIKRIPVSNNTALKVFISLLDGGQWRKAA